MMKLDRSFISGGIEALKAFNEIQPQGARPDDFAKLSPDKQGLYEEFRTNAEIYAVRLDHAGKKFRAISAFEHFYIWVQGFMLPMVATASQSICPLPGKISGSLSRNVRMTVRI